jgi:hypothetical protein
MTDKFLQITVEGATYHIPLQPLDPRDRALDVSFIPGSGPAKLRLPIFANGSWYAVPLWSAT